MKLFDIPEINTELELKKAKKKYFWLKIGWIFLLVFGVSGTLSGICIFIGKFAEKFSTYGVLLLIFGLIALAISILLAIIWYRKHEAVKNYRESYVRAREGD